MNIALTASFALLLISIPVFAQAEDRVRSRAIAIDEEGVNEEGVEQPTTQPTAQGREHAQEGEQERAGVTPAQAAFNAALDECGVTADEIEFELSEIDEDRDGSVSAEEVSAHRNRRWIRQGSICVLSGLAR
ncbi:MAG: hypothetical protein ACJAYU_001881 [Bradymonadia bacterium]|jgi:hypothetical protein